MRGCPLWVISGHCCEHQGCPLCARKQTFSCPLFVLPSYDSSRGADHSRANAMSLTSTEQWLDQTWRQAMAPEPLLTVSEWADQHRVLPSTSAEPGPWRTARTPYLAEIMDCLSTGSHWERVVLMKGAQLGATEAALNWIGYIIHHAPGLALLVMPSLDMARRNTRTRLDPMIEATPALREVIAAPRSRDAYNSAFTKSFPGGVLVMTGANSAAALRSTPARYLALDEVDGFPPGLRRRGRPRGAGDRAHGDIRGSAQDPSHLDADGGGREPDREGLSRGRPASLSCALSTLRPNGPDRVEEHPLAGRQARRSVSGL